MGRNKHIPTATTPPMMIEMWCRKCRSPVTVPLRLLTAVPARVAENEKELFDPGTAAFTHDARTLGDVVERCALDHGIIVNTADLVKTKCYESSFGCCGFSNYGGPNLMCRYGHLIGSQVDDCCGEHFAHLSLQYCEFFPLPPT